MECVQKAEQVFRDRCTIYRRFLRDRSDFIHRPSHADVTSDLVFRCEGSGT